MHTRHSTLPPAVLARIPRRAWTADTICTHTHTHMTVSRSSVSGSCGAVLEARAALTLPHVPCAVPHCERLAARVSENAPSPASLARAARARRTAARARCSCALLVRALTASRVA